MSHTTTQKTQFTRITSITCPVKLQAEPHSHATVAFDIVFESDAEIPHPQVVIEGNGKQLIFKQDQLTFKTIDENRTTYTLHIKAGTLTAGWWMIRCEGCQHLPITEAAPHHWIKKETKLTVLRAELISATVGAQKNGSDKKIKIYYGIHKHMHQPYYRAADMNFWDGEKNEIFGSRTGPYAHYLSAAVRHAINSALPHAGVSTSFSGSLIEQLDRCEREGLCGGAFSNWKAGLRAVVKEKTTKNNPRLEFSAFGQFHPLMPLMPERDIIRQIELHRECIRQAFDCEASRVLFPPETAFHVRMIPALNKAGIRAVIYDSIHRYRSCSEYPFAGKSEGMLPPNRAEQTNPKANDWLQLRNVWAGSQISPSLLRPEYVKYEDQNGKTHTIIAIPAERYLGNEDARGGFGALQYPDVFGQLLSSLETSGLYDEKHPPYFILHSDGDNYGGGAESYYNSNFEAMCRWLNEDPRFELMTPSDYLDSFPPDEKNTVHIEPGSWSGADNGDPQFMKWFSRYNQPYSPDLNSWAVLTALQNLVHTLADAHPEHPASAELQRLMLTAETSCYWYWTGQNIWDEQVTAAANAAFNRIESELQALTQIDKTGPTIFAPWVTPENPGGKTWGEHGNLRDAEKTATIHTFIHDLSGISKAELTWYTVNSPNPKHTIALTDLGEYASQTGARLIAHHYTATLPENAGDVRYFIRATDHKGNTSVGALERVFVG